MSALVEVRNLVRHFGTVRAVDGIDFAFDAGEICGFIGPNGAGKSTTMRILGTLDLPTAGDCVVAGHSCVDEADRVRRLIGYMPDALATYANMTVWEYLDFFARAYGLNGTVRMRAVGDTMAFCQLDGLRDKDISTLSKGMRQRLGLGRCLIHDPRVLILDEPSAGLDPRARIEFRDLLRLLAAQGKAILISSHILTELEELCQRVAIIELGRLIAAGPVAEVHAQAKARTSTDAPRVGRLRTIIDLRLSRPHPGFAALLAQQPEVAEVHVAGEIADFRMAGGDDEQERLLRRLIEAGVPLCSFAARPGSLEDLFMDVTEGKVQ